MQGSVSQWSNPVRSVRESGTQQRNQWRNISPASLSWPAPDPQLPRRLDLAEAGYLGRVSEPGVSTHSLWWVSVLWRLIRSAGGRWGKCLISRLCVRERERWWNAVRATRHTSQVFTRGRAGPAAGSSRLPFLGFILRSVRVTQSCSQTK